MSWAGGDRRLSELSSSRSGSAWTRAQTYIKKSKNNYEQIQINVISGKQSISEALFCVLIFFFSQQGLRCLFVLQGEKKKVNRVTLH